ncbi:MAG: YihY/virulence factor BrkB family protein [Pirellulales bacterium]|nr:YihY/virulence factor BrkB family protein [Pirellulales bacterium]
MGSIPLHWSARQLGLTLKGAFYEWNEDKVPRMAAAIAFYAVFSLTPIVVIAFKVAQWTFGPDVALREILSQAAFLIGPDGAEAIEALIKSARPRAANPIAAIIGVSAMIFAATGMFTELKDSLNTIWEVQPKPGLGLVQMVFDRFFAFAMVLVIWFLMLVSLLTSAAMAAFTRFASSYIAGFQFAEALLSLALITLLFALIYRFIPDVRVAWRDVWLGAIVTAILFVAGKTLFGLYLGHSTIGSSYGAAGSLVIVMLWVYYSCLILLFGAEMTQVQARLHHTPLAPTEMAVHVSEQARVQQGIPRTEDIAQATDE